MNSGGIFNKLRWGFLAIFTLVGLVFSASLALKSAIMKAGFQGAGVIIASSNNTQVSPELKYFFLNKNIPMPRVGAQAYLVGDLNTGEIILEKNKEEKLPIASLSKLMTALVAEELGEPSDLAQVSRRARDTHGVNGGLRVGEKIKLGDLLYPLLLESSNDAAEVLAEHLGRGLFLKRMNEVAESLQMSSTFFDDPSGLSINNQSTALDLFKLARFLKKEHASLIRITAKRSYADDKHNWSNNNQFLGTDGYLGGKSGYTDPARQTGLSLFIIPLPDSGTRELVLVVLGSRDRFADINNILGYVQNNVRFGIEKMAIAEASVPAPSLPPIPETKQPEFVTLTFLGDIMLDRGVENSVKKNWNGDYSALFEKTGVIKEADIAFANLEGPASDRGRDLRNLYSFRMDPSAVPALRGSGLDILSVANNHVGDFDREAFEDTLARLDENEILYTGGGLNKDQAEQPTVVEKKGIRVGFLGFSDVGPEWMRAKSGTAGILIAGDPSFEEIIQNAAKEVDHLVVSIHFGDEYVKIHNDRQERLAHQAIDNGAKIVIGHHPHIIQDTEIYKNGYIAYSLGNFIFDQAFSEDTMEGMMLEMKLWKNGQMEIVQSKVELNNTFQPDKIIKLRQEKAGF